MGNRLPTATVVTPAVGNAVPAAFGTWVSRPYSVPGTPGDAEEVNFLLTFAFAGATQIDILPEHATPDAPTSWFPFGRIDVNQEVQNDLVSILPGNLLAAQTAIDLSFKLKAGALIRLNARGVGGGAPTLDAKVTAGGAKVA